MAYFKTICTKAVYQPHFEGAAEIHNAALNAYLMTPTANGKKREVESVSTKQVVHNGVIVDTTVLCCEDGESE